jgi:hypothetical protein
MKGQKPVAVAVWTMLSLFFLSGIVCAEVIKVPEEFSQVVTAIDAAEENDTIEIWGPLLPTEDLRALDSGGKALTLIVANGLTTTQGCPQIHDFEGFDEGDVITDEISDVTFQVIGDASVDLYIEAADWFGFDFPSKVLMISPNPSDFSPDYFQMVFDKPQYQVRFNLGPDTGWYYVSAYNAASGGTRVLYRSLYIDGDTFTGTQFPVTLERATGDIKRVVVQGAGSRYEAIDNLSFGLDPTPPEVVIDLPAQGACVSDTVAVEGIVCDSDGKYDRDRLEYRRIHPEPDDAWTLVHEWVNLPVCAYGSLYSWDTTAEGIVDGVYLLRVTAQNACGLTSSQEITVYVSNEFDTIDLQSPISGSIVGGDICLEGTVWEWNCFDNFSFRYRPSGGFWSLSETYESTKTNEPIVDWNYPNGTLDGIYELQVTGTTTTGKTLTKGVKLILDNTPPVAEIDSPASCSDPGEVVPIVGTAYDANLYRWRLDYWNTAAEAWELIRMSETAVIKDELATWNRGSSDGCADVIRLRVWDESRVNSCSASTFGDDRHMTETFVILSGETAVCHGDYDGDGDVDAQDLSGFAGAFGGSCP